MRPVAEYKEGEIVNIAITGARVINSFGTTRDRFDTGTVLVFRTIASDDERTHTVNTGDPGVTVERVTPAGWPPQPGDLWRDTDGEPWFFHAHIPSDNGDGLMASSADGRGWYKRDADGADLAVYAPWTLVHREEQAGGEPRG